MGETKSGVDQLPPGWVRLTLVGGGIAVVPIAGLAVCDHEDGSGRSTVSGPACYHDVAETVDDVAALIAEAQRAQRRFDALPGMAALVMQAQVGCPREDWTKASARSAVSTAMEILMHVDPLQATALLDAIEARERGE